MIFKPERPIREWRFQITLRYNDGSEDQVQLTDELADQAQDLLERLPLGSLQPARPVASLVIEAGDQKERWIPKGINEPDPLATEVVIEPQEQDVKDEVDRP